MATPEEHYQEAEKLLEVATNKWINTRAPENFSTELELAQVHAILATYRPPTVTTNVNSFEDEDDRP